MQPVTMRSNIYTDDNYHHNNPNKIRKSLCPLKSSIFLTVQLLVREGWCSSLTCKVAAHCMAALISCELQF